MKSPRNWQRRRRALFGTMQRPIVVVTPRRCAFVPLVTTPVPLFKVLGRIEIEVHS